jgi:hypothetical protein
MLKIIKFMFHFVSASLIGFILGYLVIPIFDVLSTLLLTSSILLSHVANFMTFDKVISLFTAVGSIATFGTLVYLIIQNKEQKAHESKQVKMWDEQNEQLCFQKYQAHRAEFFNLISSIEERYKGIFVVKHKNQLYKRLFPRNSFMVTIYNYEREILCSDNPFLAYENFVDKFKKETNILKLNDDESRLLESKDIEDAVYKLDLSTCKILNLFGLECTETPKLGFVYDGDFVLMNGLSPFSQIDKLMSIANELRQFANMPPYYGTRMGSSFYSPFVVAKKVIMYYMSETNITSRRVYGSGLIMVLLDIYEIIDLSDDERLKVLIMDYMQPMDFFGHNNLLNNFNYNIESVTIELQSRLEKLNTDCADKIEKDTRVKLLLAKVYRDLDAMS